MWLRSKQVCPLCKTEINTNKPAKSYGRHAIEILRNIGSKSVAKQKQSEPGAEMQIPISEPVQ